jgi:hypothetical protein
MTLEREEQQEILSAFERGHRLHQTRSTQGWQDVLDLMEEEVVKWEHRLLNTPSGESEAMLRDLHAEAKVSRAMMERIQIRIQAAIDASVQLVEASPIDYKTTNL